jgi:hypothetical protein
MPKVAAGFIPEKICYVYSDETEVFVGCAWDIDPSTPQKTVKAKVLPAFPIDDSNVAQRGTATSWAEDGGWDKPKKVAHYDTVDNVPITGVKVFSLEERGQGGRAYKAVIGNYYVDLREDVLMDTLLQAGVEKGGILLGEFVWAKMKSQMRLIRVGSELHRMILDFDSKKDWKPVGKNDLEVGGVYQTRKKDWAIFLGYINTTLFIDKNKAQSYTPGYKADFDFGRTPIKKAMLFHKILNLSKLNEELDNIKVKEDLYKFEIKKTHNFIEKVDQVELPDGIIESIRLRITREMKARILELTGHGPRKVGYGKIDDRWLHNAIAYHSDHLNMYKYGATPVEPFEVKKFLLFS